MPVETQECLSDCLPKTSATALTALQFIDATRLANEELPDDVAIRLRTRVATQDTSYSIQTSQMAPVGRERIVRRRPQTRDQT